MSWTKTTCALILSLLPLQAQAWDKAFVQRVDELTWNPNHVSMRECNELFEIFSKNNLFYHRYAEVRRLMKPLLSESGYDVHRIDIKARNCEKLTPPWYNIHRTKSALYDGSKYFGWEDFKQAEMYAESALDFLSRASKSGDLEIRNLAVHYKSNATLLLRKSREGRSKANQAFIQELRAMAKAHKNSTKNSKNHDPYENPYDGNPYLTMFPCADINYRTANNGSTFCF